MAGRASLRRRDSVDLTVRASPWFFERPRGKILDLSGRPAMALKNDSVVRRSRRGTAAASVVAGVGLLLVGWVGLHWKQISMWPPWADTRAVNDTKLQAEEEARRRSEQ